MTTVKYLGLTVLVGIVGFSIGHFFGPEKIKIEHVEKVIYKERTDLTRNIDKKETIRPDGTRTIETLTTTKRTTEKHLDKEIKRTDTRESRPNWHLVFGYETKFTNLSDRHYRVDIQRRIFSEIYVGVSASSNSDIGLSIGVGF